MTVADGDIFINSDKNKLDIDFIHSFLTDSYWAEGISKEIIEKSIEGSLCFGVYENTRQIGFARVITDKATFAYLADVFIDENYRGRGLSKKLITLIMAQPDLQKLRRFMLATKDAHGLYSQYGFSPLTNADRWMQIHQPDLYKKSK
jgi:N-acetylglutamate synthase-like GNAT family acetyltransferase